MTMIFMMMMMTVVMMMTTMMMYYSPWINAKECACVCHKGKGICVWQTPDEHHDHDDNGDNISKFTLND